MVPVYWIYLDKLNTPMSFRNIDNMLVALAGINHSCMVTICCGYDVYKVNSKVIGLIANNYILKQPTIISYCGESYPLEDKEDVLSFLRKCKTEQFYIDGIYIRAITNKPFKESKI